MRSEVNKHRDTNRPIPEFWLNAIDASFSCCDQAGMDALDEICQRDTHWMLYQFCYPLENKYGRFIAERYLLVFMKVFGFIIKPMQLAYDLFEAQSASITRSSQDVISDLISFLMKRVSNMRPTSLDVKSYE